METNQFLGFFEAQDFDNAAATFKALNPSEQQDILKELYYQSREAKMPIVISVLYRKLHEGNTFEDFQKAWMPPEDSMQPFNVGEKTYYHYFDVPTRVINAVNTEDPSDIISVGMLWCSEEKLMEVSAKAESSDSNDARRDSIAQVAEKTSSKIYVVLADTNLGT